MEIKRKRDAMRRQGGIWGRNQRPAQEATSDDSGPPIPKRPRIEPPVEEERNVGAFVEAVGGGGRNMERMGELWGEIERTVQGIEVDATRLGDSRKGNTEEVAVHESKLVVRNGKDVVEDYCLKKNMIVHSENSLEWARHMTARIHIEALQSFVTTGAYKVASYVEGSNRDAKLEFAKGLLHWRHPSSALSTTIASQWKALVSETGNLARLRLSERKKIAMARVDAWQAALRSLYYSYRYGNVDNFYILLSTTTVLFGRVTSSDSRQLQATVSSATMGLRDILNNHAVNYSALDVSDGDPLLSIEGDQHVQALFNCLLDYGPKIGNASDVPLLLCDRVFAGGMIASLAIPSVRKTQSAGNLEPRTRYIADIQGLMTPQQVSRICTSLRELQDGHFSAHCSPDLQGSRLNICVRDGRIVSAAVPISRPFAFASKGKNLLNGEACEEAETSESRENPLGLRVLVRVECHRQLLTNYVRRITI